MISTFQILTIAFAYICLLFFIAYYSDKNKPQYISSRRKALVYSFSLAVYCTSWTFYGAVGSASETGWGYLPIYLGPILMYTLGWSFIKRFVEVAHQQNATSISDFIASRYDKSQTIAAIVTIIAVVATIPYIALQLKAITLGILAFDTEGSFPLEQYSGAFYITIILIVYSILFGTRNIEVTEHQYGMMNAIAFESVVKLVAFSAVGYFAIFQVFDGPVDLFNTILTTPRFENLFLSTLDYENFLTQTVLAAAAIFCLPRQFHVSVVEYHQKKDLKYARVIFPIYLILFSLLIIPIVVAGAKVLDNSNINTDFYVLFLPISQNQGWLSAVSFIGGMSAATAMVIVATVTLSTMVSNDLILPNLINFSRKNVKAGNDLNKWILMIRRLTITFLLLGAYLFYRIIDTTQTLASFGLVSFSAVIQFAPALVLGMFWLRSNKKGALAGLILGTSCWLYFIWPALNGESPLSAGRILSEQSLLTEAVLFSLLVNIGAIMFVSLNTSQTLTEKIQSFIYVEQKQQPLHDTTKPVLKHEVRVRDLKSAASLVIGKKRANALFENFSPNIEDENQIASQKIIEFTENALSGVIGAPSARELLKSVLEDKGLELESIFSLLSSTSLALKFNRNLLDVTMDNITQGINVVDNDNRLVGWNKSYVRIMEYPEDLLKVGMPIEEVVRFNVARGYFVGTDAETYVREHLKHLESGLSFRFERIGKDGRVIEIKGNPLPDGGCVTTYTDISEYKQIEAELRYKEQQIALYTDNVPAALAYIDINHIVRFCNKFFADAYNHTTNNVIGRHIEDIMTFEDVHRNKKYLVSAFRGEKQQFESSVTREQTEYFNNTFIPDLSQNGEVRGVYFVSHDISHLRHAELALKEINITLENRVLSRTEELNNTVLALEQAKTLAEKADQSKSRFMAAASHDLMQPFNAARLFCQILKSGPGKMSDYEKELVEKTDQSLRVAGNIIQSLVEFIKLDSGNVMPQKKSFLLQELLSSVENQFSDFTKEKSLKFKVLPSKHAVYSDPKLLYRILQNLLSNALRYTKDGGILVTNRIRNDKVVISVWDTGVGIEEEVQDYVFDEFKRFHSTEINSEDTGLGLGLSISQRIADRLGHSINVRSKVGRGTVFNVLVDKASSALDVGIQKTEEHNPLNITPKLRNMNVLCVDNNLQTLDAMASLMASWHYNVETMNDISDIKEKAINGFQPDIIIVDYQLDEGRTGVEFVRAYKEEFKVDVPVLFVTANYSDDVQSAIFDSGYEMLYKPVKPLELRSKIGEILEQSQSSKH